MGEDQAKKFEFELGSRVSILGNETGEIIGRAEYIKSEPNYLVRYINGSGVATEAWWSGSALKPVS